MQLEHNRFSLSSNHLPAENLYYERLEFRNKESLSKFSVDSDRVIDTIMSMFGEEPETNLESGTVAVKRKNFCHTLEEIHLASVDEYLDSLSGDGPEASEEPKNMKTNTENEEDYL